MFPIVSLSQVLTTFHFYSINDKIKEKCIGKELLTQILTYKKIFGVEVKEK